MNYNKLTKAELISEIQSHQRRVNQDFSVNQRDNKKKFNSNVEEQLRYRDEKELFCLSEVGRISNLYGIFSENLFQELPKLIPPAFQFPEITCANIEISGSAFQTDNFSKSCWGIDRDIYVQGQCIGKVEVYYLEERAPAFNGPFLKKEVTLVHAFAEQLGIILGYRQSEKRRMEAKEQLYQAKFDAVKKLSRGVAHDFNNLLTIINGYSGYILKNMPKNDAIYSDIKEINKAGVIGAELTKRLVTFSGPTKLDMKNLSLNSIVLDVEQAINSTMSKNIKLAIYPSEHPVMIKTDPGQLNHVLFNLVENAKEAMPDGGTISLHTSFVIIDELYCLGNENFQPGEYVTLTVSDTGTGMTPEIEKEVLDPLFTTKRKRMAVGLGLPSAYRFVKQSNGFITVCSNLNVGTSVTLYFPAINEIANLDSLSHIFPKLQGHDETIMIVYNDENAGGAIARILGDYGYTSLNIASGTEAIQACKTKGSSFNLVVLNNILPDMCGPWLNKELLGIKPDLRTLMITDYGIMSEKTLHNADNFIYKPINISQLLVSIRLILENAVNGEQILTPIQIPIMKKSETQRKLVMILSKNEEVKKELFEGLKCFKRLAICHKDRVDALAELKELYDLFDYVIIDQDRDDNSCREIIRDIHNINPDIRIVILSNIDKGNNSDLSTRTSQLGLPLIKGELKKVLA